MFDNQNQLKISYSFRTTSKEISAAEILKSLERDFQDDSSGDSISQEDKTATTQAKLKVLVTFFNVFGLIMVLFS